MSKIKSIFRYIFTIVLTISLIIYITINVLSSTILDKSFVLNKLDETGYYDKVYGYALTNFENYIIQSGLEESVLEGILTREDVVNDTQKILNNIYNNIEEDVDATSLKERLNANIEEATKSMLLTTSQKEALNGFIDEISKEYLNTIAHFEFEKNIFNAYHKIDFVIDVTNKVALVFIGVSIFGLIVVCTRRIYKLFTLVGITLLSSGLFFTIVNIYINAKINIQTITILNNAFSFTLREILGAILNKVSSTGILMLCSGLVLIVVSSLVHNFFKYKDEKN